MKVDLRAFKSMLKKINLLGDEEVHLSIKDGKLHGRFVDVAHVAMYDMTGVEKRIFDIVIAKHTGLVDESFLKRIIKLANTEGDGFNSFDRKSPSERWGMRAK